jgi:two-component system, LytTR family, response regulator
MRQINLPSRTESAALPRGGRLTLLIVDHEPLTRSALVSLCAASVGVQVIGEADSGIAAIDAAEKLHPDVMLLDAELPDMTGFEVLRAARRKADPLAIMVSTQASREAPAFNAGVIDYLVKPIGAARFAESIDRARLRRRSNVTRLETRHALPHPTPGRAPLEAPETIPTLLVGERQRRLYVLKPEAIEYIEAHDNYVKFHAGNVEFIRRDTVTRLATELTGFGFLRIARSVLINVRAIVYAQRVGRRTYAFTLNSGSCLQSGATYLEAILRILPLAPVGAARSRLQRD